MIIKKLLYYIHTLNNLKQKQIIYRLYYTLQKKQKSAYIKLLPHESYPIIMQDSILSPVSCLEDKTFSFLNKMYHFTDKIDWNYTGYGMLWAYNLNYFEFLHQPGFDKETGLKLMYDFIGRYKEIRIGYDSYPISLRNLFWIRFISKYSIHDEQIDAFLYDTYTILSRHIEYHLLGNHVLENAFSLLFGAYYFRDQKLYDIAYRLLRCELDEQILPDGGHFELSPMYHQIILVTVHGL